MKASPRSRPSNRLAVLVCASASMTVAPVSAEEGRAYRPITAQTGKAIDPPAGLVETARALREAAATKNAEGVFALLADDVTFVSTGITLEVPRRMEKKTFASSDEALEAVGLAFTEGEPLPVPGKTLDPRAGRIATAFSTLVPLIDGARWGRDPLVVGGYCTSPGAKWDPTQAKKAGIGDRRGGFVTAETHVRAAADPKGRDVATLRPGQIFVSAGSTETSGWEPVTLPSGKAGWAPPRSVQSAQGWGICFLPDGQGGWLWSAVVSSLL